MDKLVFQKSTPCIRKYPNIRIDAQMYNFLANISTQTGMTISAVANKMLEFASERTTFAPADCPLVKNIDDPCFISAKNR